MDLGIVSPNFPSVGAAADPAVTQQPPTRSTERHGSLNAGGLAQTTDCIDSCSCPPRTVVPVRRVALPFECTPANNSKMEEWLLQRFASSTFNTCPHRPLPCMTGPPVEIHLEDGVIPRAVNTAAPSQGSAYLTKPSSPCQNTWTPSATFRHQHLPRTFAAGLAWLIRLRTMHNCATLWHHSNHFSAQGADSNGDPNLNEPSKHQKSLSSQRSAMV